MPIPDIKLLLLDVDGVLTDGSINITTTGTELKRFYVRDGSGIIMWRKHGLLTGILTGRPSPITTLRAAELGIELVEQCAAMDKLQGYESLCAQAGVQDHQVAYIGDDLADIPVLTRCAYPITVADATDEAKQVAKFITTKPGGHGAVREAIEHLLKAMNLWETTLDDYGL